MSFSSENNAITGTCSATANAISTMKIGYREEVDESNRHDYRNGDDEGERLPPNIQQQQQLETNCDDESVEDDRKPAAKPTMTGLSQRQVDDHDNHNVQDLNGEGEDESEDEGEDNQRDDDDENEVEDEDDGSTSTASKSKANKDVPTTDDGRPLSEYELQRLERIKRNREYLSQLGLSDNLGRKKKSSSNGVHRYRDAQS
jgi:hypothetical protein